ncbi:MAG TPA: hypothetical protein VF272_01030, partial [Candidatus Saccharimonadia bacterium]
MSAGALNAAEAGAEIFMNNINNDSTYQGTNNAPGTATDSCTGYTSAPVTFVENAIQGKVTYETCVKDGTITGEKMVYATAKVYLPTTAASPRVTRKIRLIINQALPASYTIMSGPGGLKLGNNVRITAGPIYVGGKLEMDNNAVIGSIATPVTTYVADKACPIPANATFPDFCPSGNSITTDTNSHVYGDTHVLNNVDAPSRFTHNGVVDNIVPPLNLPPADHATLTSGLSNTTGMSSLNCPNNGTLHLSGHYTGTSTSGLTIGNNCTILLDGNVWLDGNLALGNNSTLRPGDSVATPINLIIDGSTGLTTGNNNFITANASGVGFNVYTFWSADTTCRPNCSNVIGAALADSQGITTINLSNNVSGSANILFYSRWTKLMLNNNITVGQLLGQAIELNNNGNIVFSSNTSTTPGGWDVRYYERLYR